MLRAEVVLLKAISRLQWRCWFQTNTDGEIVNISVRLREWTDLMRKELNDDITQELSQICRLIKHDRLLE